MTLKGAASCASRPKVTGAAAEPHKTRPGRTDRLQRSLPAATVRQAATGADHDAKSGKMVTSIEALEGASNDMNHLISYQRAGQRAGLLSGAIGLVMAATIALAFGLGAVLKGGSWLLLCGALVSVLGLAGIGGRWASVRIKEGGNAWAWGITLALAILLIPTILLSLMVWIYSGPTLSWGWPFMVRELGAYVLKPLYWIGVAGLLPACLLGLLYAKLVRRAYRKLDGGLAGSRTPDSLN